MWVPTFSFLVNILQVFNFSPLEDHKEAKVSTVIKYTFPNESIVAANAFAQNRFPNEFLFGFTTSAYQIEGGSNDTDKGESLWDHVVHFSPELIKDSSNADIAADSYHKFKTDVYHVKDLGANTYRISLSWTRILPTGFAEYVSFDGVEYYNNLINEMLKNGITPIVTLYDVDLPYKFQQLGGWTNPLIIDWFNEFSKIAFSNFGDRVKHWVTINSPYKLCRNGYGGTVPPAVNQPGVADYICGHNVLLAHGKVYSTYDSEFRWKQDGKVGLSLDALWFEAKDPLSDEDVEAAERLFYFTNGWFLHPILGPAGDYPEIMKKRISEKSNLQDFPKSRLPVFKTFEILMLRNSIDFLGLNYYNASMVQADNTNVSYSFNASDYDIDSFYNDAGANIISSNWSGDSVKNTPWALKKFLIRTNQDYKLPPIYILENGYVDHGGLNDMDRSIYHHDNILEILEIAKMGFDIRGYLARTLLDAFEWQYGYTKHFGFFSVNYDDRERPRTAKLSTNLIRSIYTSRTVHSVHESLKNVVL